MSDQNTTGAEAEIADLPAGNGDEVRGGKKGSFDITEADASAVRGGATAGGDASPIMKQILIDGVAGDPSQWGVSSLNYSKIEV